MPNKWVLILIITFGIVACQSSPNLRTEIPLANDSYHGTTLAWHRGSVQEALDKAKKTDKPIFIYWGARWCPPCNHIKAEVFTKDRFAERMAPFISVYIDGDQKNAQTWAEKLNVSGYPTLLFLNSEQKEVMRVTEAVTLEEFERAVTSALLSGETFYKVLNRAALGKAKPTDWTVLAYSSWYKSKGLDLKSLKTLGLRKKIADRIPNTLPKEKALLSARLLEAASSLKPTKESSSFIKAVKSEASTYVNSILDSKSQWAARESILFSSEEIFSFLYPDFNESVASRWIEAARQIGRVSTFSLATQIGSIYPEIVLNKLKAPKTKPPQSLINSVRKMAKKADREATTKFERQSVISSAAYFLRKVGDFESARELLEKESKRSDSPWYFYSSLSNLESEAGNPKKAAYWSKKAKDSAKGRATKLQWLVNDILLTTKQKGSEVYLASLLDTLYPLLFQLDDGFLGRNHLRLKRVKKALLPYKSHSDIQAKLLAFQQQCEQLKDLKKRRCENHFKDLLSP